MLTTRQEAILPYWGSDLAEAVGQTRHLTLLDLDGSATMSGENPSVANIAAQTNVNQRAYGIGGVGHSTARTFEQDVSSSLLYASRQYGVNRPEPRITADEAGTWIPPERLSKYSGYLNPHLFCGFGTGIYIRHKDKFYVPDHEHVKRLRNWRADMLEFLVRADEDGRLLKGMASIEYASNYFSGTADVYPLEYRIQLEFRTLKEKEWAKGRIRSKQYLFRPGSDARAQRIEIVDESNPPRNRYVIYLTPRETTKEYMLSRVIHEIAGATNILSSQMTAFVAGDTLTDVRAGFEGGHQSQVTFLLVGGSRISQHLSPNGSHAGEPFAGEKLSHFTNQMKQYGRRGWYEIKLSILKHRRFIVIGDEAYDGAIGPESIIAHFDRSRITA